MPYLIDGHNLIPHIKGMSLKSLDDEMELIDRLQVFCREHRQKVEVFFDGAPAEQSGTRKVGVVTAHFVPKSTIADDAITSRLRALGRAARNWTVVSSDRRVQGEAHASQAKVMDSAAFSHLLSENVPARGAGEKADRPVTPAEIEEWLRIFDPSRPSKPWKS
ncbi:MAG TPA: NYN domain-containing protein [Longilinea sp.]|nr:NYN domain-containing protein [Longilinea sp.]